MKELIIQKSEENQRLDKFLAKYMEKAPKSFFYKMLRKKNIKLNGKKAEGNEKIVAGDRVTLYLSEETIEQFRVEHTVAPKQKTTRSVKIPIIYEDEHIVLMNKPSGFLTQKAKKDDISLNDWLLEYAQTKGQQDEAQNIAIKPSVCNRLDRNTSGLVIGGISLAGLQIMSELLKTRKVDKYYLAVVKGRFTKPYRGKGWVIKEEKKNQVTFLEKKVEGADLIETSYEPIDVGEEVSLIKVHLITGKTHQIRVHLAYLGFPIVGDTKYGDAELNREFRQKYRVQDQLLHAQELQFHTVPEPLAYLSNRQFQAPVPLIFQKVLNGEQLFLTKEKGEKNGKGTL